MLARDPEPIRYPKSHGATTPPAAVPTEKNRAIASARISSGKISLTVRYAELAAAEAKKKITVHNAVWLFAERSPLLKSQPVAVSSSADIAYVADIICRRPMTSKKWPRISGPRKFPRANGRR